MNLNSLFAVSTPALLRRSVPLLLGLLAAAACSEDEEAPAPQPDFGIAVASLDGIAPDGTVPLQCNGKLAVAVSLSTSIERVDFILRPRHACGASKRCGYVRVEGLNGSGDPLGQVDTVTTTGLLELEPASRALLAQVRVTLISGVDQKAIVNADGTEVSQVISPTFTVLGDCPVDEGMGGQGGQGAGGQGAGGQGGAGGEAVISGGAGGSPAGGAGGAPSSLAGAGGAADGLGGSGGEAADPG